MLKPMLYLIIRKDQECYDLDYRDRDWIFDKETLELIDVKEDQLPLEWPIVDMVHNEVLEESLRLKTWKDYDKQK